MIRPRRHRAPKSFLMDGITRSGLRLSNQAVREFAQLETRAIANIRETNEAESMELAKRNLRILLEAADKHARDRKHMSRLHVRYGSRPIILRVDVQAALRDLCPLWPFC